MREETDFRCRHKYNVLIYRGVGGGCETTVVPVNNTNNISMSDCYSKRLNVCTYCSYQSIWVIVYLQCCKWYTVLSPCVDVLASKQSDDPLNHGILLNMHWKKHGNLFESHFTRLVRSSWMTATAVSKVMLLSETLKQTEHRNTRREISTHTYTYTSSVRVTWKMWWETDFFLSLCSCCSIVWKKTDIQTGNNTEAFSAFYWL